MKLLIKIVRKVCRKCGGLVYPSGDDVREKKCHDCGERQG